MSTVKLHRDGLGLHASEGGAAGPPEPAAAAIPDYLREVYGWAYLDPVWAQFLDRDAVVSAILLGNNRRLRRALVGEIAAGQRVLHAAHVYGRLLSELAARVGREGRLDVVDVVPLQAELCRDKLRAYPQAHVRIADAADPGGGPYDVATCFFLLHELPDERKRAVVDALLASIGPGGKAVFVDYHAPARWHPLRGLMRGLFDRLEPFAESLWRHEIAAFAGAAGDFDWRKQTLFGGLYQKTVAHRPGSSASRDRQPSPASSGPRASMSGPR